MTTETKKNHTTHWTVCILGFIALLLLTIFLPQGFWLGLPFFTTGLALAMDWV